MAEGSKKHGSISYTVLTSLVHGRPQKVMKPIQPGNGFGCYRVLAAQTTSQLRARALALLQSVLQYMFSRALTLTEKLQRLDDIVNEYETASGGKKVGDDLLVGILFKNALTQVSNWLLAHLKKDTPHSQARETVRNWGHAPTNGHRQAEGWKKQQDETKGICQVELPASSTTSVAGTASLATTSATTAGPSASQVRRVELVDPESCCVIYDLREEETQETAFYDNRIGMLRCEFHRMDKDDDLDDWTYSPGLVSCDPTQTRTMTSFAAAGNAELHHEHHEPKDSSAEDSANPTDMQVGALYKEQRMIKAILDFGSDMTVIDCAPHGVSHERRSDGRGTHSRDARGNQLKGTSQRRFEHVFEATRGERLKVRQMATVAESVKQPLISAGQFFKNGWTPGRDSSGRLPYT
eukprot:s3267_g5.t1